MLLHAGGAYDFIPFRASRVRRALEAPVRDPTLGRLWMIQTLKRDAGYLIVTFGFDVEFGGRVPAVTEFYIVRIAGGWAWELRRSVFWKRCAASWALAR